MPLVSYIDPSPIYGLAAGGHLFLEEGRLWQLLHQLPHLRRQWRKALQAVQSTGPVVSQADVCIVANHLHHGTHQSHLLLLFLVSVCVE